MSDPKRARGAHTGQARLGGGARTLLLAAIACASGGQALAQEAGEPGEDEIVVTAQRRAQALQDVPAAITAVTEEQLQGAVIRDTQSLQQLAPSLVVTSSTSETNGTQVRIRGIGTSGQNLGFEPAVGVFVDGVVRTISGIALNDLLDVERIEVLRGPQGTLFGKNTSAGAIVISTAAPEFDWGGAATIGAGNFDWLSASGHVTGPLLEDQLAFRLSGSFQRRDGFITNVVDGTDINDRNRFVLRGQTLYEPTPDVSFRFIVDYAQKNESCCAAPFIVNGPPSAIIASLGGTVFNPTRDFDVAVDPNRPYAEETEEFGVTGILDWDLGAANLNVIGAYRDFTSFRTTDGDFTDLDLLFFESDEIDSELVSLEAQLTGRFGRVDWLAGGYWFQEDRLNDGVLLFGADLGRYVAALTRNPALTGVFVEGEGDRLRRFEIDSDGWALFTHNIVSITDWLDLTIGARYLSEVREGGGTFVSVNQSCTAPGVPGAFRLFCNPNFQDEAEDEALTFTANLAADITDDILVFFAYTEGYKSGGVNLDRAAQNLAGTATDFTFRPEESTSFEAGIRTQWFDRRLTVNLTGFYTELTDFQLSSFNGINFVVLNAGSLTSEGVELETVLRPIDRLTLSVSAAYNPTEFGDEATIPANLRGRQVSLAPEWTVQGNLAYAQPLVGAFEGFVNLNARYQTDVITAANLAPATRQEAFAIVNGRLGVRNEESGWEASLFGANLFNEVFTQVGFNSVLQAGSFNAFVGSPRFWGVELTKRF